MPDPSTSEGRTATLRKTAVAAFRHVPVPVLARLVDLPLPAPLDRAVAKGLGGREVVIRRGPAAGLRYDAAEADPFGALGTYETPVQEALVAHLQPGDVFYDIGANVGFFSVLGARLVAPGGWVYAFEPAPDNAELVRRNLAANRFHHTEVLEVAVAGEPATTELELSGYAGGHALVSAGGTPDHAGVVTVEAVVIDDLVAAGRLRPPTLVKIDVEGAELDVLHGMARTIDEHRPHLLVEVDHEHRAGLTERRAGIEAFLGEAGYEWTELEPAYPGIAWEVAHLMASPTDRSSPTA
ncbi:MAG: FkbM family methyltransferase [Actinomycetota bacterium]|nr:FkbM family methyltransferase [Actinomycetota bacterium]